MVSFNLVYNCNSLDALRKFSVFLNTYPLFNRTSFVERWLIKKAKGFIERAAAKAYTEVLVEIGQNKVSASLNDCPSSMFAILYLANERITPKSAQELFSLLAETELSFEKLKKPRGEAAYTPPSFNEE
jgi:hypothetical protein